MSEPTVAHEIIDSIIDHLQSDKAALTACSLVSKTWTLRSTHHLFSHVSINKWNFKKIQTLPQPSSRIVGRVRMLLIYLLNHEQATSEHLCPRVQPFSSVTVLALFRVYFSTFDEFTQLLCCFPKLQVLSLNTLIWNQEPTTPLIVECGCPPMELHTLNVGWQIEGFPSGIPWLFEWFLAKGMPPLSTVRLRGFSDEDIPLINDALKNLRNSLRSLELELGVLRSLELELGVVDDDDNVAWALLIPSRRPNTPL
ncbi:hypothetical protein FPV67DRAFT_1655745 [Lyophyllum atratum]|nr:hypothetical protein FPV67DRAFT_1655745 [Lyophyllum atratum]